MPRHRPRGRAIILRADALNIPLADASVDLIVTSPPYFALRSYEDAGEHYAGQVGDEATPADYVDALLAVTRECVRVLKPTGSLFVNLGDKYAERTSPARPAPAGDQRYHKSSRPVRGRRGDVRAKSLIGLPWRYALACVDELELIMRAEIVWAKPNAMPESVMDRVKRAHETFLHLTPSDRYYAELDPIREPHAPASAAKAAGGFTDRRSIAGAGAGNRRAEEIAAGYDVNPLGAVPGSVWSIATQPFVAPDVSPIDGRPLPRHFAAFPMEWPRRLITAFSPSSYCLECGEPRRPLSRAHHVRPAGGWNSGGGTIANRPQGKARPSSKVTIVGETCACGDNPSSPTRPAVVLDPFGGTGTTALVAAALGRLGIATDLSHDYARLALWRTNDVEQQARAAEITLRRTPTAKRPGDGQLDLLA